MHLEPLAYAANVIQAAFCRLDTVLLTFGWLVAKYKGMTDPQDQPGCAAIISSLERRWSKTDQEVFIVAVLLHPLFRTKPFKTGSITTNAAVSSLFLRVYHRLYQTAAPFDFIQYMDDYLEKKGVFDNLDEQVTKTEMLAAHKGQLFDPLDLFKKYCHPDRPDPPFIGFAKRIFSITANSASCERLFSAFGVILTKRRNKLLPRTMTNINELAMHVHDEHLRMKHSVMARGQKSAAVVENIRSRWLSLQQIVEASSMPPPSQPNPSPSLPVPSTTIADAMAFGLTQPSDSTMSFNQPYSGPDSDLESDASDSESEDELTSADLRSMTAAADGIDAARNPDATFSDLVQAQGSLASEDDTDNDPLLPRAAANSTPSAPHRHLHLIPLSDLFDFNNPCFEINLNMMYISTDFRNSYAHLSQVESEDKFEKLMEEYLNTFKQELSASGDSTDSGTKELPLFEGYCGEIDGHVEQQEAQHRPESDPFALDIKELHCFVRDQ
ncbi:hypothetical protein EST38_g12878 [Candolleomyces aberdarensis]|uniref:HAT C-terminal dimerisation domain-containing protein n=1 Tax=Candolleomyces aberdarensis TaxID=2316362 RepID=A0A4Q2D1B1_9AGAR|nr:hypothetical protein EST38_g12878 [Candolleomyces aberdarensis]